VRERKERGIDLSRGLDLFEIDSLLTEEHKMVRKSVGDFVQREFVPVIQTHHREGIFPMHLIPKLASLGVFGVHLKGYGCAGMDSVSYGLIMQELERGDSGLRSFASVQSSLSMTAIHSFGSEEQKKAWLPELAAARKLACFGLTEPDFGSNPAGMRTRAKKDGNHYILNGSKAWITNGTIADVAVVWAKTEGDDPRSIRGFLVEKGTPGFSSTEVKGKFSMRASVTAELSFDDCRIPVVNILPGSQGLKAPLACLTQARYGIAWGAIGAARACCEAAISYAKERVQFDRPIAGFQLVQEKLSWMAMEITKAQCLSFRLAQLKDEGKLRAIHSSMAKMNNVKIALEIARMARDILGANGITDEYPVIRHLLNLESVYTYEGTHNIHLLILGQELTGLGAFS